MQNNADDHFDGGRFLSTIIIPKIATIWVEERLHHFRETKAESRHVERCEGLLWYIRERMEADRCRRPLELTEEERARVKKLSMSWGFVDRVAWGG